MGDWYLKAVLTVIAGALVAIAVQNGVQPARALGDGCGSSFDPCYVSTRSMGGLAIPLDVKVTNWP
jgi:hypothetical protein